MATAATPKGTTHNVSTPKAPQVSAGQAAPGASPHSASGTVATAVGTTHNKSTPKKSAIPAGQRRPDVSPHA
jgi:hypothetical protein